MLETFFDPRSIAVIGASRTPGKVGHDTLRNIIEGGYEGKIFPVNPKADEVLGLKCYPDLLDIPEHVDLAIVVIQARHVLSAVERCARKGVGSVIIISAGFGESGEEGARLSAELKEKLDETDIRCIGPNCLGVMSLPSRLNATFAASMPRAGNIAFFSQSGAMGTALLDVAVGENIGLSRFISYGNKLDVDQTDLIGALGQDDRTEVILGYVESIEDGPKFMKVAREVARKKPVILMKSGRTSAGARAASSHTGSLAGSDTAYDAAFKQCGVIRGQTVTEFLDYAIAFSAQKPPVGDAVAVVTNAGGPGIIATDAIETSALRMAELREETRIALAEALPPAANIHNPVDVLGDASAERYRAALELVVQDSQVDAVLILLTPQTSTEMGKTAEVVADIARGTEKTVLVSFMGAHLMTEAHAILRERGVPNMSQPERAVKALEAMMEYSRRKNQSLESPPEIELDSEAVRAVIEEARRRGAHALAERQARHIVEACGVRLPGSILATSQGEAVEAAEKIGYPVVLKVSSEDILHKSDAAGVKLSLEDDAAVRQAFADIMASAKAYKPDAAVEGVLVQEMVTGGTEVIVGMNRDPQFGPLVMFGLGGIYVELLKDVSFRVAPLTAGQARRMVEETRSAAILKGFRGSGPADVDALVDCLLRLSRLAVDHAELAEFDVNPLKVFPAGEGVVAVDVRFVLA